MTSHARRRGGAALPTHDGLRFGWAILNPLKLQISKRRRFDAVGGSVLNRAAPGIGRAESSFVLCRNLLGAVRQIGYVDGMPKISAGLLMYRIRNGELEFLLAHPGGPYWKNKDASAWTIPKGEIEPGEAPLETARREFQEELGFAPDGPFLELTPIRQKSGKLVHAWAFAGDCDPSTIRSNNYQMEWPPHSGRFQTCPEVDCAQFFFLAEARTKIIPAQIPLLEELREKLDTD